MTDRDREPYLCDHGQPIPGACDSCDPPRDDYTVEEQRAMRRPPADPPATPLDDDNLSCVKCGTGEDECEGLMDDLGERCCKTCHHIGKGEPATPPGEAATAKAIKHLRNIDRIATESIERLDELKAVVNGERPAAGAGDEVQRWDVGQHMLGRECENVPSCDGGWVLYEDHAHALAAERAARVAAEQARDEFARLLDAEKGVADARRVIAANLRIATERAEARATAAEGEANEMRLCAIHAESERDQAFRNKQTAEGALAQAVVLLRDAALDDVASETYRRIQSFLAAGNATTGGTT
jgi:hypothetical protein